MPPPRRNRSDHGRCARGRLVVLFLVLMACRLTSVETSSHSATGQHFCVITFVKRRVVVPEDLRDSATLPGYSKYRQLSM